ncbi:T9SS type A sorting domain-containing protein [Wenyingzhuangia aestuarii]|uniref:T9SS type A sorting domain-containing protein n=1 Tax=Wenyingzhuangia aestuarii TaxID=1647582 RepID=UPI00143B79AD|nr:T9SS type A sorting domain-containing protein [Wenyingzhuangia aestuarii]NJB84119.1 hypothetical protein [Wenyingzhuangia aestuarii]
MKKITLLVTLLLMQYVTSQTLIFTENFEICEGTYSEFGQYSDGSADYFVRTDGSNITTVDCDFTSKPLSTIVFTNTNGFYYTGEDTDRSLENPNNTNPGAFGSQTYSSGVHFAGINISEYGGLTVSCSFAAINTPSFEPNLEYIRIYVNIDNAGWQLIGAAAPKSPSVSSEMAIDTNLDGTGNGTILTEAFQKFTFDVPGTGTTMNVRIEMNSSSSNEELAFDTFELSSSTTLSSEKIENDLELMTFYPNPFHDTTTIKNVKEAQVYIYNSLGVLVDMQEIDKNNATISLIAQKSGVYLAKIVLSNGNSKTLKIVKK